MKEEALYDIAIIGGGINGAGIARDAAGRGLSVLLCERDDLGGATSSASTKLIHGGLRYLEYYEFRLVREALREREVLLRAAPHIIWPLRFVLPHVKGLRPAWMIRAGLFLYDHIGGRKTLPATETVRLARHPAGKPLADPDHIGFIYSDCWVQDSRLVVLNAMDAAARGADIRVRTECTAARRENGIWLVDLAGPEGPSRIRARSLVNATGPWCNSFLQDVLHERSDGSIRMIKGSHIVVPKLFDHPWCYIFQNPDGRIVFAIPYEQDFTLIGTTEADFDGDPRNVHISAAECRYLCDLSNRYFSRRITPDDVVWSYSGVRPLYSDGARDASAVTRDYVLKLSGEDNQAPLLNIFGGKITTYRRLAEAAMSNLCPRLGHEDSRWTENVPLPGGDLGEGGFDGFLARFRAEHSWLPQHMAWRLVRNYGSKAKEIIGAARSCDDLGRHFGGDFYEAEARYLIDREWARSAEDILWRRSKLGLHLDRPAIEALTAWCEGRNDAGATGVDAAKQQGAGGSD